MSGLVWAGAAAVLALWWFDTPSVAGLADWLINAGRITGLLAGYAVIVLIALMARIPALEHGVGTDRLARWHAMGGRYTVSLVVVHGLLITWGYAVQANTDVVNQSAVLLLSYPNVLAATVAGLLLLGVGLISARAARSRLRYETWFYLHFYTYLATALAFSHQFSAGADFVDNLPARVVWSILYIGVGVVLLWYRFLLPVRQALRHQLRVSHLYREGPGVVSIVVTGRHLDELAVESGQFFRWRFLTRHAWWAANPFSLSAPPVADAMRLSVKDLGEHSHRLKHLRPGTRVLAEGPYGAFTAAARTRDKVLLLAAGVGITPLRALFETLPGNVVLLYRARSEADILFRSELDAIAAGRGTGVHYLLGSRQRRGADVLSPRRLAQLVPDLSERDVYVCGPPAWTTTAVQGLRAAGVRRRQIHSESFEL
ncbi:ferric reductase-like transmembrane domain-containing protein [Paenarthrobacter sp. Z7-10]|uniref:ferredoxin reductase family protein n=1 Tax=Paenarthrobacter sp. Z7-10 TaxID=2787635 RepID=UPI0022A94415|nr:ferric reductase-like transmembrane domain-containing protein [Paenarthrobacter sp. Z7-10]MCZ2404215.1 ferric reductase-like transmembrane domain-containing protein [Paenarthrobacter sp. Z7-10]